MPIFTGVISSIRILSLAILLTATSAHAWDVDFSRRQSPTSSTQDSRLPASLDAPAQVQPVQQEDKNVFEKVFSNVVPTQDIVIINTEQGFIPATVHVKEGSQYRIVVVNVNDKAHNVSFVLDAFSEHHATFYGKMKTFYITPKREGVYSYLSPETSAQGRLIVYPANGAAPKLDAPSQKVPDLDARTPASE